MYMCIYYVYIYTLYTGLRAHIYFIYIYIIYIYIACTPSPHLSRAYLVIFLEGCKGVYLGVVFIRDFEGCDGVYLGASPYFDFPSIFEGFVKELI